MVCSGKKQKQWLYFGAFWWSYPQTPKPRKFDAKKTAGWTTSSHIKKSKTPLRNTNVPQKKQVPGSPWPPLFLGWFLNHDYFSRGKNHHPKGTTIFKMVVDFKGSTKWRSQTSVCSRVHHHHSLQAMWCFCNNLRVSSWLRRAACPNDKQWRSEFGTPDGSLPTSLS